MARTPATPRRAAPIKVSKQFPWATVLGSVVLGSMLIGLITYAALNQGSGRDQLQTNPDAAIEGVSVASGELEGGHVTGPVTYEQTPPNSGDHSGTPQQCAVYAEPIAPEYALHSLEHGAVWITYNDKLPADQVEELAGKVEGDPYGLMSPVPNQTSPINLSAWGRRLSVDSADDPRIDRFLEGYASGPTAPERGAACAGNTTTGPVQGAAAPQTAPTAAVQVPVNPSAVVPVPAPSAAG